jgi:hypothetical protein
VTSLVGCCKQLLVLDLFEDGLGVYVISIQTCIYEHPDYLTPAVKYPGSNVAQAPEHPMNFGVLFLILLNVLKPSPPERSGIELLAQVGVTLGRSTSHALKIWLVVEGVLSRDGVS